VSDKLRRYCETLGEEPFDWWKAFDTLETAGRASEYHYWLFSRASQWVTCACGNQCALIPRGFDGAPLDEKLAKLGIAFCGDVGWYNLHLARQTLRQIELRSAELLAEMGRKEL
jgi:hypothetical protein